MCSDLGVVELHGVVGGQRNHQAFLVELQQGVLGIFQEHNENLHSLHGSLCSSQKAVSPVTSTNSDLSPLIVTPTHPAQSSVPDLNHGSDRERERDLGQRRRETGGALGKHYR